MINTTDNDYRDWILLHFSTTNMAVEQVGQ